MVDTTHASHPVRIPRTVWVLGFVSLLMDISSEMIHSLLPLFMTVVLGASATAVGVVEGIAEATALIVKVFSGMVSDRVGKRKRLAVIGYALGALSKPVFALAGSVGCVLTARFADRIGKGIRGAAFGLRQSLDTIGAFTGPLLAIGLMLLWGNNFRAVFWVAVIPGLLAVALLACGVHEPARPAASRSAAFPVSCAALARMPAAYWWVVVQARH